MKRKALVVLEPKKTISYSNFLGIANKTMGSIESSIAKTFVDKISRRHKYTLFDSNKSISHYISKKDSYNAFQQAIKVAKQWYEYKGLQKLLQVDGINIGKAVQLEMANTLKLLFECITVANSYTNESDPDNLYLESDFSYLGRAFEATAIKKGINYEFLQPYWYRQIKNNLRQWVECNSLKNRLKGNLYAVNNRIGKSKYNILADVPYINWFNAVSPVISNILDQNIGECYILGKKEHIFLGFPQAKEITLANKKKCHIYFKKKSMEIKAYYQKELKNDARFHEFFTYQNISLWRAIRDEIALLFNKKIPEIISNLEVFSQIVDTIKPDILVIGTGDKATPVAAHVLLAKKKGIPVLEIRHGIISSNLPPNPPWSDKIAVGGDYWKKLYINKIGARENQIVVTGWPKFDSYTGLKKLDKQKRESDVILFATQPIYTDLNLTIIENIGSYVEKHPNTRLIIKPHPTEKSKVYSQIAKKYKNVISESFDKPIAELMASSDVVIIVSSTVGLEAALLDKPIICINMTKEEMASMYISSGVAIEVNRVEELIPTIEEVLYNKKVQKKLANARKKFVYEHAYIQDGKASERVANVIIQMIEESKKKRKEL